MQQAVDAETVAKIYDEQADDYDSRYLNDTALFENRVVQELVLGLTRLEAPRLLDIGCGTGLALELELTTVDNYLGVDPSPGMIKRFSEKFSDARTENITFEGWYREVWGRPAGQEPHLQFDLAISLFGSPSYIDPDFIEKILHTAPAVMMMHYREGYWPYFEEEPLNSPGSRDAAEKAILEAGGSVITFNNFRVSMLGGEFL